MQFYNYYWGKVPSDFPLLDYNEQSNLHDLGLHSLHSEFTCFKLYLSVKMCTLKIKVLTR